MAMEDAGLATVAEAAPIRSRAIRMSVFMDVNPYVRKGEQKQWVTRCARGAGTGRLSKRGSHRSDSARPVYLAGLGGWPAYAASSSLASCRAVRASHSAIWPWPLPVGRGGISEGCTFGAIRLKWRAAQPSAAEASREMSVDSVMDDSSSWFRKYGTADTCWSAFPEVQQHQAADEPSPQRDFGGELFQRIEGYVFGDVGVLGRIIRGIGLAQCFRQLLGVGESCPGGARPCHRGPGRRWWGARQS